MITRLIIPRMIKRKDRSGIVFISSNARLASFRGAAIYSASK